jgi:hypothetical protein
MVGSFRRVVAQMSEPLAHAALSDRLAYSRAANLALADRLAI